MIVTFRSDAGPLEGFLEASFRVAVNDDGVGSLTAPPEVVDAIEGFVECEVDGQVVFRWRPEDREATAGDDELVVLSGRGRASALERVVVLPVGYPAFTDRTRTETGAPFAVFATLLAEGQARGRATDLAPSWTPSEDSKGDPWTENVDVRLEPGTTLRELLDSVAEVEGAEWIVRPNGDIDAAPELGDDRSGEVVLFYGADQVARDRRSSTREQRQTVFVEASTGVSEATNTGDDDLGEIWLEAQDYADPLSRQTLADKLALKLGAPEEEATVAVAAESGPFVRFRPGDTVGLDTGSGTPEPVRVVGLAVSVTDQVDVTVDATLITEVALRQQRIERAIQARADVQLAAAPVVQRRHGLVTADKILTGELQVGTVIQSQDYAPGVAGWVINGDGSVEFADAVFRGDLESVNYDPGVDGWRLDRDGDAEFNEGTFRGAIVGASIDIGDGTFTVSTTGAVTATSGNIGGTLVGPGVNAANLTTGFLSADRIAVGAITGPKLADGSVGTVKIANAAITNAKIEDGTIRNAKIRNGEITGAKISGGTITGANISGGTIEGANIASGTIGGVNIADLAVTSGKVANNAVVTRTISNGNVTDAKIASLTVDKLTGTTISGFNVSALTLDALTFNIGSITMSGIGSSLSGAALVTSTRGNFTGSGSATLAALRAPNAPAVAAIDSTAARFDGQGGLRPLSSSRRSKTDIVDAPTYAGVLDLRPVHYRIIAPDTSSVDYGLIAEEVDELGITGLVSRDADGEPRAVNYELVGVLLVPLVRDLAARITALERRTDD